VQNYNLKAIKNQAGMTLIELTVVLLVLIGLAGLTLPYVQGFIGKTHNSTSAATGADLFAALSIYQSQNAGLPNNLNLLTDKLVAAAPLSYLDNTFATQAVGAAYGSIAANSTTNFALLTAPAANAGNYGAAAGPAGFLANAITSLQGAGITRVAISPAGTITPNADGTYTAGLGIAAAGATFTPEVLGTAITPTTTLVTDNVQGLSGVNPLAGAGTIATALGYTPANGHQLIVLGVGAGNAAVGKSLAAVPVHFGDKGSLQPTYTYSRFLAAVDVDTLGTGVNGAVQPAKIVGIVHAPDVTDGWESLFTSIAGYYAS
jgi:type II secretory pathway pseudopilin PulG